MIFCNRLSVIFLFPLLFSIASSFASSDNPPTPSIAKKKLSIVPVNSVAVPANRLLVGGTVVAKKSVVFTAQLPGRIISIAGEEGDKFKAGSLLVKINDDELLARRHTAVMQLANANSAVQNANVQFSRQIISRSSTNKAPGGMGMPGMFDQVFTNPMADMMGTRDYDMERHADIVAVRSQLEQAYNAVQQAHSQIRQIDTKLRDTQSIAPFSGTIVKKAVEIGDPVQPGQTLLVYEDLDLLEIIVDVPSRLIQNLHRGQSVGAKIDGYPQDIIVTVNKIFPTSDPVRHTTRVKFTLQNNQFISPGNYAEVRIPVASESSKQSLLIPASAIIERGGLPSVFVVSNNRIELHLVRVGDLLPSGDVVVLYGVKDGQYIIDKPPSYITSGYEIK